MEALLIMDSEKKIIKHSVRNQPDKDSAHSFEDYKKIGDLALKARYCSRFRPNGNIFNPQNLILILIFQNDMTFLRIKSKKHEIMVAPGNLHDFDLLKY